MFRASGDCHDVFFDLIRARNSRLRNLGIVPLLLCRASRLSSSLISLSIPSQKSLTSFSVGHGFVTFVIVWFLFAGLWQLFFYRRKNFVNLTWDCYLGNPIKKHSLKKVV